MFLFLKSLSRSVHHQEQQQQELPDQTDFSTSLTVWRKSLLINCKGFTVIDSNGNLIYRVDNYSEHPQEIILMDASGKSLLTMRRLKKLTVKDSWLIYEGEVDDDDRYYYSSRRSKFSKRRPICCVKKQNNILLGNQNVLANVYYHHHGISSERCAYTVEGSYTNRSCKVLDVSRRVVAEIKRKEANIGGVSFGVEVFVLNVQSGFDSGFAMALVLLLDQMFS